ncbi:response regulator [Pedobacter sp. SYSU D00535]|uniref:response regulator n=1 Tax=Pedobacter sp. SYSU D00535 TaxID=2810308 RepID=UPI001A97584C|nr:response regulator [Pedobacter sp. SYSU D00535]
MKRVLVCDDDITVSEIVALVLTDADWEVYTLPDCNNIIEKVEAINPSVIFMDNKIPDEGGIVATQKIKQHPDYKEIPVIYFTANSDIDQLAEEAGADLILQKPFNIKQLEDTVQQAFTVYQEKQSGQD